MHDGADPVLPQCRFDERVVGNIAVHERVTRSALERCEGHPVARECQGVEHDDQVLGMRPAQIVDEVGADDSDHAGDQQLTYSRAGRA